jgi:DNA-binding transcriptional MerR regulator
VQNLSVLKERQTFRIGQAAEALSVTPSWLRFGKRLGALRLARRDSNGWKYYTPEDFERLRRLGVGQGKQQLLAGGDE